MSAALLVEIERLEADNAALRERVAHLREHLAIVDGTTRSAAERDAFVAETAKKCEALRREAKKLRSAVDARKVELDKAWHERGMSANRRALDRIIQRVRSFLGWQP